MFSDIALLVHNQAEDLDNIELNLNKAKDYLEKAEKTLVKAKAEHQKTRKVAAYIYLNKFLILYHLENVHSFNCGSCFIGHYSCSNIDEID